MNGATHVSTLHAQSIDREMLVRSNDLSHEHGGVDYSQDVPSLYSLFTTSMHTQSTQPTPLHLLAIPQLPLSPINLDSSKMPPPSFLPGSRKRKLAPAHTPSPAPPSSASPTPEVDEEDDDEEYAPHKAGPSAPTVPRKAQKTTAKGGQGAAGKGMSREALRKANHSLIERRRREKINAALGELRDMVPDLGADQGSKGVEFKLEVLERTVDHLRELKGRIVELEAKLHASVQQAPRAKPKASDTTMSPPTTTDRRKIIEGEGGVKSSRSGSSKSSNNTLPSPSLSPDPNETDQESNLPPPYALANRPPPSLSSLLSSRNESRHNQPSRPPPGPQATNPTLYLPFPTPSPTSPFLTYNTSTSSTSSNPPEPSPFLAPLHNISLFGGALNLDHQPPIMSAAEGNKKGIGAEEAANLLLAFSSPDVLKPINGIAGLTPKMVPIMEGDEAYGEDIVGGRHRRATLDSEEFVLDGGIAKSTEALGGRRDGRAVMGKTARDILKM